MEMILSGKLHPGLEAARLGLVHRAVPDGELAQGGGPAGAHPAPPAYALSLAMRAVKAGQGRPLEEGCWRGRAVQPVPRARFFRELMHEPLASGP